MKTIVRINIITLICLCSAVQSSGQLDTLNKFSDGKDFQVDGKFRDRTLEWTLNATGGIMYDSDFIFKYGIGTAVEYKLSDYHSLGAGFRLIIYDEKPLFWNYDITTVNLEIDLGYRYYHNLRKRMSKGQAGNNFSANYFLISPYLGLQYKPYTMENYQWDFDLGTWAIDYSSAIELNPGLRLGYGLQRNFAGNFNFDINGGIQFRRWNHLGSPAELLYIQFSIGYILK